MTKYQTSARFIPCSIKTRMERIIECVPNFSEGRDPKVIEAIANAISKAAQGKPSGNGENAVMADKGVKILHIDRGEAANRTVITFAGSPESVMEAAFNGVRKAAELIDMRIQHGTHPRSGATDVLPLVPVKGVTLKECATMARALAGRIFDELGIPCYCYEAAAFRPERKRLEVCRSGEYEALPEKIADPQRRPDFSPDSYNDIVARSGAINVGARNFLIAVNFNLDSCSAEIATEIARDVRESGRVIRHPSGLHSGQDRPENEKADGGQDSRNREETVRIPGTLKGCKAIGWYIKEYGIAQVSMNITDINAVPLHRAFEEVCRSATAHRVRITGTEIIGLVPEKVLLDSGEHFLSEAKGGPGTQVPDAAADRKTAAGKAMLIETAVRAMGLNDLRPFDPEKKVIEYCMRTGSRG